MLKPGSVPGAAGASSLWPIFVASAPGLEGMLLSELAARGLASLAQSVPGGVELQGDLETVYRLNLELGLALKVLLRVAGFNARRFDTLVRHTAQLPWEQFCTAGTAVHVRATCKRSRLYHSTAVAERVREGMATRLRWEPPLQPAEAGAPLLQVHARLQDDHCVLSIDCSGELLSRRGYRLDSAKAPLREDLARALILSSGWDGRSPLIDPFAGSGTIAIEAEWLARKVPPGWMRVFAFMDMPLFDRTRWNALRERALSGVCEMRAPIFASDRDPAAIRAAQANAERAQARASVFVEAPLSRAPGFTEAPGEQLALVTNPPYGQRLSKDSALHSLYRALGERVRARGGSWRVAMAVANPQHARATGLHLRPALMTDHGGSKIYFSVGAEAMDAGES